VSVRIAIWDPLPIYRRGIIAALADMGTYPEEPENLLQWTAAEQKRAVLLTMQSSQEWTLLTQLRDAWPDLILIAVLTEATVDIYVKAIEAGATAAVARNATSETVTEVLSAAIRGMSILPVEVVRVLATPPAAQEGPNQLNSREIEWLRALSQGVTVGRLAENVGYSERAMYRLLRDLYKRMQAANRTEAVLKASRRGWL
jgi:DNA-binding NarL/FixJ family response regulator